MSAQHSRAARAPHAMRITENPALYGLVLREHGQLVEFVSYQTARRRLRGADNSPMHKVSSL